MAVITMNDLVEITPEKMEGSSDTITLQSVAGQRLKVETIPDGEEIFDLLVPAGKMCTYRIVVSVELADA